MIETYSSPMTRKRVLTLVWPVILAQAATALTGIVDTAAIGTFGDKFDLAAVAIAAVAFSFIYWGFGFLRMSTTGLTAQAIGRNDKAEARAVLLRALILGGGLGLALLLLGPPLKWTTFALFTAETDVETLAGSYFNARIWGAPALLMGYGITGWLLGTGRTTDLLVYQVILNGVNAGLDLYFVMDLDLGPAGIGAGTAIAEWTALGFGLFIVRHVFKGPVSLWNRDRIMALFGANRDIMIRTMALLFCFAWFVNAGTRHGTAALAGNEVLLQFVTVAAFVLDGFAFIAEKETGEAVGARDPARLTRAVRLTTELALISGAIITLGFYFGGGIIIKTVIGDTEARDAALTYLPYCAIMPLIGVLPFQLDGIFIGATHGRALRVAGILAAICYIGTDMALQPLANHGVWLAFLSLYLWRAVFLGVCWPGLVRSVSRENQT